MSGDTRIIELILTYERVGDGTEGSPFRCLTQLWTRTGNKVAECDPHTGRQEFNLAVQPTIRIEREY